MICIKFGAEETNKLAHIIDQKYCLWHNFYYFLFVIIQIWIQETARSVSNVHERETLAIERKTEVMKDRNGRCAACLQIYFYLSVSFSFRFHITIK